MKKKISRLCALATTRRKKVSAPCFLTCDFCVFFFPLINTQRFYLISPQRRPCLSVVEQQETAREGDKNTESRAGGEEEKKTPHTYGKKQQTKPASTQARRCIFMHPCLKCQEFLTLCDCGTDTSPRSKRTRIY